MKSTEEKMDFSQNAYREAVVKLSEVGKLIQTISQDPALNEMKLFALHYIQITGNLLRDIQMVVDLKNNPNKISSEVTPRERTEKSKLSIPVQTRSPEGST